MVGGGPAGFMAAGRAAERGLNVLMLEKMKKPGRKLLLTGKGRCNITNNLPSKEFIKHVYPNGRFLRPAFSQFFSRDILELLERYDVPATLERGGRYFPKSNKSVDVLRAFMKWNEEVGVKFLGLQRVQKLLINDGSIRGVQANNQVFKTQNVILAAGGKSYPATGSTGQGYELAKLAGHTIEKVRPSLVPLETEGEVAQKLEGLNLKNVRAIVWVNNRKFGEGFGEMLFTHFGLSGPIILTLSRIVVDELHSKHKIEVTIDLKPALDDQKLDKRLLRDINENGKKKIINIFKSWLPSIMIPVFIDLLNINPEKECNQISAQERKQIRYLMKNLRFKVNNHRSFKEAIITAGGVSTNEINSKTMESKLVSGLYFAGEMIDVDAETGGFNLQIAYSTGWLAGNSVGMKIS